MTPLLLSLLACGPVVEMGDVLANRQFRVKETLGVECEGPEGDARLYVSATSFDAGDCGDGTTDSGWSGGGVEGVEPSCEALSEELRAMSCSTTGIPTSQRYTLGILFTGWDPVWPMEATPLGASLLLCSSDSEDQPPSNNFEGGSAGFTHMEESRDLWVGYPAAHGNLHVSLCD